ncbi:hypothetical protein STSO111631_12805 [Stackebrandtia soli]
MFGEHGFHPRPRRARAASGQRRDQSSGSGFGFRAASGQRGDQSSRFRLWIERRVGPAPGPVGQSLWRERRVAWEQCKITSRAPMVRAGGLGCGAAGPTTARETDSRSRPEDAFPARFRVRIPAKRPPRRSGHRRGRSATRRTAVRAPHVPKRHGATGLSGPAIVHGRGVAPRPWSRRSASRSARRRSIPHLLGQVPSRSWSASKTVRVELLSRRHEGVP